MGISTIVSAALIVVDFQNDFCPGGTLAVPQGDEILPVIQGLIDQFTQSGRPVAMTQDFHPPHHVSFREQGGPWPPHCVQGTAGCALHPDLKVPMTAAHFYKGFSERTDAYSGFEGRLVNQQQGITDTDLESWLRGQGADTVYIAGLATDYCVRATALDALARSFDTRVISNAVRGVNVSGGDSDRALTELKKAGARVEPWILTA